MSILDTFFILFKANTDDLKKGSAEAETILSKTQDKLKQTAKQSDMLGSSFLAAAKSAAGLFGGLLTIGGIVSGLKDAVSYVDEIGDASRRLNIDPTALDAWGHAVQRTGGSSREFQSSLESLATHLGTTNEIALRALPHLADSFSKLSKFRALQLGKHLGIDQGTIYLLQQGRREVEDVIKQQQKLGLVTKEQVEITRKYDNAIYDAGRSYGELSRQLAVAVLPGITTAINYFIEHKDIIVGSMGAITLATTAMGVAFLGASRSVRLLAAALGILAIGAAYEDIKGFVTATKKTALGKFFGVGEKGLPELKKRNDEKASKLPLFLQKLLGFKAPDYALSRLPTAPNSPLAQTQANKTVTIQNLTINTQATDATGIAQGLMGGIYDQLTQANNFFDNSVVA